MKIKSKKLYLILNSVKNLLALIIIIAVFCLISPSTAEAAIEVDAVSSDSTAGSSITISHTTSGSNRLMLVGVSLNNEDFETVTGVTYKDSALTPVGTAANGDDSRVEIWKLIAPDIGTHDVVITFSTNLTYYGIGGVITFTGVDQTTPLGTFASAAADGITATVDVSSATGELVFGVVAAEYASSLTVGAGQTERWNLDLGSSTLGAGSTEPGAATVTTSWTLTASGNHWAIAGVSIKPVLAIRWGMSACNINAAGAKAGEKTKGITFDAASSDRGFGNITWNHTTGSENNRLLIITCAWGGAIDSIKYGGSPVGIDLVTSQTASGRETAIYRLVNPADGTNEINVFQNLDTIAVDDSSSGSITGPVRVDNYSSDSTADSSITISHTTSGSNRLMLVGVSLNNEDLEYVTGVTYKDSALTLVGVDSCDDNARVEIWKLIAPDTGTHDVVITFSADLTYYGIGGVMTFTGVDQTTPFETFASAQGTSDSATVNVSSATGELVFGVVATEYFNISTLTVGAGQTERWNLILSGNVDVGGAGSTEPGAGTVTMSWKLAHNKDYWAIAGVSIKPVSPTIITIPHTTSGSNCLMLVGVSINNENLEYVTGVTYNGVALTLVGVDSCFDDARVEIWKLIAPETGTYDVVVTFNTALRFSAVAGVMTFTGVDQTTPLGTFASAVDTSTEASVDVSSATGELVFGVVCSEDKALVTVGPSQTEYWNISVEGTRTNGAGSTEPGAETVTTSWELASSDYWAIAGVSIKPAATPGFGIVAGAITFSGVYQAEPYDGETSITGSGDSLGIVVTTESGDLVVDVFAFAVNDTLVPGTGQTYNFHNRGTLTSGSSRKAGAKGKADVTMYWKTSATTMAEVVNFSCIPGRGSVILRWETTLEQDCVKWRIYRSTSKDKMGDEIANLEGAGTSPTPTSYEYVDEDVEVGTTYYYRIADVNSQGVETLHGPVQITPGKPFAFTLFQNYPNPYYSRTTIMYEIPKTTKVSLRVYDVTGALMRTLVDKEQTPNRYKVVWDGNDDRGNKASGGVYFYRLEANSKKMTKKMVLME